MQAKKLIEVAMPIKEISAESVRDKSIRHGHISTLHLWWARRPLPVCRAVVFASLVPDPLDEHCPPAFRDAVGLLLGPAHNPGDPYKPYADIPWTAVYDPMPDNLRNRLQLFIGKFTDDMQQHLLHRKPKPAAGHQLSPFSLIKWDNKNNRQIIGKARKLIWVAHNATPDSSAADLLLDFERHDQAVIQAERELYELTDRHLDSDEARRRSDRLQTAIDAFLDRMPKVFDPFAGGGAIPLEAARLGCRTFGNDINPVAHIIQKGSLEFPQRFGKPIVLSPAEFVRLYGEEALRNVPHDWKSFSRGDTAAIRLPNRLSFDVEFFAKKLLARSEQEIGRFYPADDKGNKPIAYYWARVGTCSNPSCQAEVPLLKGFYLANTATKQVYLHPVIQGKEISFEIRYGKCEVEEGWNKRANLICPICGSFSDTKIIKSQFSKGLTKDRLIAVIEEGQTGKHYRLPTFNEEEIVNLIPLVEKPRELMPQNDSMNLKIPFWGYKGFGDMFSPRQILALHTLVKNIQALKPEIFGLFGEEYGKAVVTYLGILMDRGSAISTSFGRWDTTRENVQSPFSKQAIPMIFDYPESNLFGATTGSLTNQLEWLKRYIESESTHPFQVTSHNASSGDHAQFPAKYLDAVVTDPPYYDAIAYADLSDFFYVWLKRTVGDMYPLNFATPQTPKSEECTALKHHRNNSKEEAKQHFEAKLTQIFDAMERQTAQIVSIMFAHQSTEAWTTLCNSILGARMNITGSWPVDTEMANRSLGLAGAVLASSVTVSARPADRRGVGDYREIRRAIERRVAREVEFLYRLGFRGADLLTACFGQAVSEFGRHERVEKADGTLITVAELLEMARESAFSALVQGFEGDEPTKFYIGWLQLYGFTESDFDDAAKFTKVGLRIDVQDLFRDHILIRQGKKQTLAGFAERAVANRQLGEREGGPLIDQVHKAMHLYKGSNRALLVAYLHRFATNPDSPFWRVLTAVSELLPAGCEDHRQATGLLANKDSLLRESQAAGKPTSEQTKLFE